MPARPVGTVARTERELETRKERSDREARELREAQSRGEGIEYYQRRQRRRQEASGGQPVEVIGGGPVTVNRDSTPWGREGRAPRREDFPKERYGGKHQEASRAYEAALSQYEQERFARLKEGAPTAEDLAYSPELEGGVEALGPSMAGEAMADAASIESQRRALAQMEEIYREGGYTSAEREQIEQAMMQARNLERAGTQAARQQMAARGMVGAGAQVGAQMAAQQGSMNRGRAAAADIATAGQARALEALGGAGRVAGEMRGQSFEEGYKRGSAIDDFRQDEIKYQRDKEQRRAEAQTEANRRLGEARGEEFANIWGVTKDESDVAFKGREAELRNRQRIDQNTANAWNRAMQPVNTLANLGMTVAGRPSAPSASSSQTSDDDDDATG
tara:strand:+ start:2652 stop:3821 length:1170 start_codon:yes stop_codon:yes gene_type:complete